MQAEPKFRKAISEDIPALNRLGIVAYSEFKSILTPENWEKLSSFLTSVDETRKLFERSAVTVCEVGNEIAGMAYLVPSGNPTAIYATNCAYVRMVGVHPTHRGKGIARKLTEICIAAARANGEQILQLHTSEFMDNARHLYESLGFEKVKELSPILGKQYWLYSLNVVVSGTPNLY